MCSSPFSASAKSNSSGNYLGGTLIRATPQVQDNSSVLSQACRSARTLCQAAVPMH